MKLRTRPQIVSFLELILEGRHVDLRRGLTVLAFCFLLASPAVVQAQAGALDGSFGSAGLFTTGFRQADATMDNAMAIQSDGKIVIAGTSPGGELARLNTNGTLDTSFGKGGFVTSSFGGAFGPVVAIAIQPDGKILASVAGFISGAVGRFNTNGSVDSTFGSGGFAVSKLIDSVPATGSAFALQPDGKILVAGRGVLGRYTSDGVLDTGFGTAGIAPLIGSASAIAVQADGKILVTTGLGAPTLLSASPLPPSAIASTLARYNTDGSLDAAFGIAGQAACAAAANSIAIQSDGKIMVAGTITSHLQVTGGVTVNQAGFGLVRYTSIGRIDTSFGKAGGVTTGFGPNFPKGAAFALAIQPNGEIVVAGTAGSINGVGLLVSSFALARYMSNGSLDSTFGAKGTLTTALGAGNNSFVSSLALQSDGKIVAAGNFAPPASGNYLNNFAVVRYLGQ
jgi:uncharacterized delta-60 repeat protein